jgi:peptide/nickel transport system ATP-binding protein
VVGESGCGKTTLMMALMGLLPPNASVSGRIVLDGVDILAGGEATMAPHRWTDVALVFQGAMNSLSPVKRVAWQIAEPMLVHGTDARSAVGARVAELLDLVGLPARTGALFPHELSGGMRQRVAMAMALACRPRLLLADEPTTALDVMVQAQLLDLLAGLSDELGLAVVLVTHDLPIVVQTCARAAVMYAGRIAEEGTVEQLALAAGHPYTRLLFAATPDLAGGGPTRSIEGSPPRLDQPVVGCAFRPRCPDAVDRCGAERPALLSVAGGADPVPVVHRSACHLTTACHSTTVPDPLAPPTADAPAAPGVTAPATEDPAAGDETETRTIARVSDLRAEYPVRRGVVGTLLRRPVEVARVVDGVSLTVDRGELVALVGESGSGKTTTAQAMLGNVRPTQGRIVLDGVDVARAGRSGLKALRRRVQMVYQDPYESLDPRLRVRDLVAEPLRIHHLGGTARARTERVDDALAQVGLLPVDLYADRHPHELSGGQRQRVAIAAGLVVGPSLLIADEPVSMLDVSVRAGILNLFDRLRRDHDLGVLMITHDLSTVAHHADRVAVMYAGRIVEQGPTAEVLAHPRHPYTIALLSVVPSRRPAPDRRPLLLRGEAPNPTALPTGCRFHTRCPTAGPRCASEDPVSHAPTLLVGADARPVDDHHEVACLYA